MIDRALVAALLVAFLTACAAEPPSLDQALEDEQPEAGGTAPESPAPKRDAVRVDTVTVEPSALTEEIVLTGELRADESVALRSRASGHVVGLHFAEGSRVRKGQLLVKIDDETLQAERRRVAVRRDFAARAEERARTLRDDETISQQLYETSARELAELDAELDVLDVRIAQTELHAPFDGIVGLRAISVGSYVTSSIDIATLHAIDPIELDLAAPERHAQRIRIGERVRFEVAGFDDSFEGEVFAVEPRIDSETRSLRLRARAPNPRGLLLPGSFARVRLVLGTRDAALLVPSIALVPGVATATVYVVDDDGQAAARAVRTGIRTEDQVEILEGLTAGDRVIVSGLQQVKPGSRLDLGP